MNPTFFRFFRFLLVLGGCYYGLIFTTARGQGGESPQLLNHQGRIAVDGINFEGTGQFKFALLDGNGNMVWSNSAIAPFSNESPNPVPVQAVSLPVTKGLYAVLLGNTELQNMAAIPAQLFMDHRNLSLRVWFNDGSHGFQQITPDQRLAVAPFAAIAESAQSSVNFLGGLDGDVTGFQNATRISDATVTGKRLDGFTASAGTLTPNDSILSAIGKLDGNAALKAPLQSPTFTGTVSGITASMVGLGNVNNTSDANKPVSAAQQAALDLKAPIASPSFTGTVSGITASMVGLGNVDNTSDANKPVSAAQQSALNLKANLASPAFTGTVTGITRSMVGLGSVNNTSDANKPVSIAQQAALDLKAPLASPVFTGSVELPVGTATTAPLKLARGTSLTNPLFGAVEFDGTNLYLTNNSSSPARKTLAFTDSAVGSATNFTGSLSGDVTGTQGATSISATTVTGKALTNFASATGTISASDTILSAINKLDGNLALKANLASPTFTGTVSGITAGMVGLGNVNNTSDADKPVSVAQQAALDLRAPLASPTFTGTVSGVTAGMVGLGNVNNTSDANKPVSIAQQAALDLRAPLSSPIFTGGVELSAGTLTTPPLKLSGGTNLAAPVFGAVEFDGNNLYLTNNSSSPTRKTLAFTDSAVGSATNFTGSLSGDVTGTQGATSISATTVTGKALTNFASATGTISASDTILSAINKLNGNLAQKANLASPTFTGTVSGITAGMVGLGNVNNTSDANKPVSTAQQAALNLKANLASPTFTGTVSGITSSMVGLGNVNNTSDENKPVSTAQQAALDLKAPLASPSFTGSVQLPAGSVSTPPLKLTGGINLTNPVFGAVEFDGTNLYLTNNSLSPNRKTLAFTDSAVGSAANFTGSLSGDVTGTQGATIISATTVTGKALTNFASTTGTISASDTILSAINKLNGNLAQKANLASPNFTGTVSGITAGMVGLGNVDNTSDASKPLSTAQQTALNLKANLASPTFTGTVSGITKAMVGLSAVNNTSDANKPVSTAQLAALNLKAPVESPAFTGSVQLPAGTTTTASLKLSSGTILTTPTFGSVEFDGTNLYLTNNSASPTRRTIAFTDAAISLNNLKAAPLLPVLAWGRNNSGQTTVPGLAAVVTVAAGESHSLALLANGSVMTWGNGSAVPAALTSVIAIAAGSFHDLAVKSDGTVAAWGDDSYGQITVPTGIANATQAAAGEKHSLILRSTGAVTAWGDNSFGQTTVPATASSGVMAIAAGYDHSLALKSDGSVVAWGRNDAGQTDVPVGLNGVIAITAGAYHSLAVKSDGTVVAWGWDSGGQSAVPANLSGVAKVAAGYAFSAALKWDGTIIAWGDNSNGQCNVPSATTQITHLAAGASHLLALRADLVEAQVARLDQDNLFTGKLGIKRTPATNALEVEGNASKTTASSWLANSDRRIKEDIATLTGAIEKINKVRLVDFRYTEDYRKSHPSIDDGRYLNVIAQEFAEIFPGHVKESGEVLPDGSPILQVDTYPLTIYSAAAVQELHRENQSLKRQLEDQERRLRQLEDLLKNR